MQTVITTFGNIYSGSEQLNVRISRIETDNILLFGIYTGRVLLQPGCTNVWQFSSSVRIHSERRRECIIHWPVSGLYQILCLRWEKKRCHFCEEFICETGHSCRVHFKALIQSCSGYCEVYREREREREVENVRECQVRYWWQVSAPVTCFPLA